jgi:LysM repeat protein/predicted nucleic acid-binding Zn ribbon protein
MAQDRISKPIAERRCPNCGTRVARDAESCFMCGFDLRREPSRKRQISWIDALLVLAVLLVLFFWWQAGNRQGNDTPPTAAAGIPADQIPFLPPTPTATPTPVTPALPVAPASQPSGTMEHTVVQGETLLSIALDYGVTVDDIKRVNSISGDLIRPGDKLTIPNQQAVLAPPASAAEAPRGPVSNFAYVVRNGDTIISIASRLGSTVDEILNANGLTANDLIRPGDTLNIPVRQVPAEVLSSPAQSGAQGRIYTAPQSVAPTDRATVARSEAVMLRWASVDLLQPDEWYVVLLYPQSPDARQFPSIWTKATSYRIEPQFAPEPGGRADYSWQVSVVRVRTTANGGYALEPASPTSELKRFTWQ